MNQKIIVIPIENEMNIGETTAGGLRQYVNPSLIEHEKDAWRKVAIKKSRELFYCEQLLFLCRKF